MDEYTIVRGDYDKGVKRARDLMAAVQATEATLDELVNQAVALGERLEQLNKSLREHVDALDVARMKFLGLTEGKHE